jgi:hypothetical protein
MSSPARRRLHSDDFGAKGRVMQMTTIEIEELERAAAAA